MIGEFCSGRQTENRILHYLFVAEAVWHAVTSWKNMEFPGQGMIGSDF